MYWAWFWQESKILTDNKSGLGNVSEIERQFTLGMMVFNFIKINILAFLYLILRLILLLTIKFKLYEVFGANSMLLEFAFLWKAWSGIFLVYA